MTTILADRYALAGPLGSGGMARVVAAHDRVLDRRVAVKLIHEALVDDPTSRRRLLQEARAAAALHHPSSVSVFDVGEEDGQPFIVMELVEGHTLADRLGRDGRLAPAEAVAVASAVLDALEAAHGQGLVHRDVKPANILLPDGGGVKLADFGIAKALAGATAGLTATGQILGTPRYLSPEQAAGEPATPASDLYALGAVLYECLAGRPPFVGDHPVAVAVAHQQEPVRPLAGLAADVPPALAAAVEQALAKDPRDRHRDAGSMRRALQEAVRPARSPAAAPPAPGPSVPSAGRQTARRRRLLAVAGVVVALLALVAVLGRSPDTGEPGGDVAAEDAGGDGGDGAAQTDAGGEERDDLAALVATIAGDPGASGERGPALVEELLAVRAEQGGDAAERSRSLMKEVGRWMAEGELVADVGRQAIGLLAPLAAPPARALADAHALFAEVATDMPAWGSEAGDLLSDLEDLLSEDDPEEWADDAEDLVDELEEWITDGEIDRERGRRAIAVLTPLLDARR